MIHISITSSKEKFDGFVKNLKKDLFTSGFGFS